MNIPTYLVVAMYILYALWSLVEMAGLIELNKLTQSARIMGRKKPEYSTLGKAFTFLWVIVTVVLISYWVSQLFS